jgi:Fur family ferric uptake transcriptional regulator
MENKTISVEVNSANSQKTKFTGMKKTSQRALILEIIHRGHLDANEIHKLAQVTKPRLSLSTVYRTLKRLKELGFIDELNFNEPHLHYEMKTSPETCHLVCLRCGEVTEFGFRLSPRTKNKIIRGNGFRITGSEIQIFGYCAKCRGK